MESAQAKGVNNLVLIKYGCELDYYIVPFKQLPTLIKQEMVEIVKIANKNGCNTLITPFILYNWNPEIYVTGGENDKSENAENVIKTLKELYFQNLVPKEIFKPQGGLYVFDAISGKLEETIRLQPLRDLEKALEACWKDLAFILKSEYLYPCQDVEYTKTLRGDDKCYKYGVILSAKPLKEFLKKVTEVKPLEEVLKSEQNS